MRDAITRYFTLSRPVLGATGVRKELALYSGVLAGAVGQWVYSSIQASHYDTTRIMLGVIASIVTFPAIYHNAGLEQVGLTFTKWCVAFQSGFFWPALLQQVGDTVTRAPTNPG